MPTTWLLSAACFFWIVAKLTGWKAWIIDRSFPVIPPFEFFSFIPPFVYWLLLVLSITLMACLLLRPGNIVLQFALLFTELISCLPDVIHWQPWECLYLFILLAFILNRNKPAVIIHCFIIAMATIYLYSGLHKFNEGFLIIEWRNMILKRALKMPAFLYTNNLVIYFGYCIPVIECLAGVGMVFYKTRKAAIITAIAMHFFILIILGPFGIHYNKIIWPWNAAMIFYLLIIFIKMNNQPYQFSLINTPVKVLLLGWVILPALNFIGLWDNFISWNIYSSTTPLLYICIKDSTIPKELAPFINKTDKLKLCEGSILLNVQTWAIKEMNTLPYPEERIFEKIKQHWTKKYPSSSVNFIIIHPTDKLYLELIKNSSN